MEIKKYESEKKISSSKPFQCHQLKRTETSGNKIQLNDVIGLAFFQLTTATSMCQSNTNKEVIYFFKESESEFCRDF